MITWRFHLSLYNVTIISLLLSGTAKNNAIKALLSDYVPSEPGNPGMQ